MERKRRASRRFVPLRPVRGSPSAGLRLRGARVVGFLAALSLIGLPATAYGVDDLNLTVAAGSSSVQPGDTVTVTLDVANLSAAINGVQALIAYDPAVLSLSAITPTDLGLSSPDEGWVEVYEADIGGNIDYSIVINGASSSLSHTVATLTFAVIDEGTTSVVFRPDSDPFFTKLTVAADNSTVFPAKTDSGAITSSCDDGLFCNGQETFDGASCQAGTDPCNDGVVCTDDVCDETADTCTNTANDANCDDLLFCTGTETCDPVNDCQPGTDPCDDGVSCTVDVCDDSTDSCTNTADDTLCDNLVFCDGAETCDPVNDCQPGTDPCDDGVPCTIDTCDEDQDTCTNTADDTFCDNGVFCDGAETCDPALDCQASTDPCAPLFCDEGTDSCLAPIHVTAVEVFYTGRYLRCHGGSNDNGACTGDADCPSGVCRELSDSTYSALAGGSTADGTNITRAARGITGIRIFFDADVTFATTAFDALLFDWTTGTGTTFDPVTDVATNITVAETLENGNSVVTITLAANFLRSRWLRVTVDATQVTASGVELDGELIGNPLILPSGDGTPGGSAVFYLGNMAGDVTGDRKTTLTDVGQVRQQVNPALVVPITNTFDVDKDSKVQLTDVGLTRQIVNPAFVLPLISP